MSISPYYLFYRVNLYTTSYICLKKPLALPRVRHYILYCISEPCVLKATVMPEFMLFLIWFVLSALQNLYDFIEKDCIRVLILPVANPSVKILCNIKLMQWCW